MGHAVSGARVTDTPTYKTVGEKLTRALVIEEVKIIEVPKIIEIPVLKNVEKEQIKYITKEETQIKFNTVEKNTVNYTVVEGTTLKYNVKNEETIKYIPKEVTVERPVSIPVEYERPVIKEKIIEVVKHSDVAAMTTFRDLLIEVNKELDILQSKLKDIMAYKLVEKVIEVPKIQWINTPVERIVWKDVTREK